MFDRISDTVRPRAASMARALVRAELDCETGPLAFPRHFKGDPVMPGCLGPRCPVAIAWAFSGLTRLVRNGRALGLGELKFSGQVLPNMKKVVYGLEIKE